MAVGRARSAKRGFEEGLRGDSACVGSAIAASQTRYAAAVLQYCVGVGLLKLLPAQGHHVRNRVNVYRLVLMGDSASDVAKFEGDFVGQLALNREVEGVGHVGPEMRIQSLTGAALRRIYSGIDRLRQGRSRCQIRGSLERRDKAIFRGSNPESSRRRDRYGTRRAQTGSEVVGALHGLDGANDEQWYECLVHTVQAAIDAAVAAAKDRIFMAEDFTRQGISVEVGAPSYRDTRTEFAVVRVIGTIAPVSNVMHQGKTDFGIVDLAQ